MSIQSEITRITNKRNASFVEVENKGVTVPSGSTIDDLPGLIAQISGGGEAISVIDTLDSHGGTIRTITAVDISNDTVAADKLLSGYTAHDHTGTAITGTLVVSGANLGTKTITTNGTYSASNDQLDGYSSVTVQVPIADYGRNLIPTTPGYTSFSTSDYSFSAEYQNKNIFTCTVLNNGTGSSPIIGFNNQTSSGFVPVDITGKTVRMSHSVDTPADSKVCYMVRGISDDGTAYKNWQIDLNLQSTGIYEFDETIFKNRCDGYSKFFIVGFYFASNSVRLAGQVFRFTVEITGTNFPVLQNKTATPSETAQKVTPDAGYDAISSVSIGAISSTYVGTGVARKSSTDLTVSGATVSVPAGYYAEAGSKSITSGSASTPATTITANPSISINSSGLITAITSASKSITPTVSAGYVASGTAGTVSVSGSNTEQLTTQAAATVTPTTSSQTVGGAGKYMTGAITVNPIPSNYIITSDATASAADILSGETAYVNGSKLTGTLVVQHYYTGTSDPSAATGSNGDIYLKTGA